MKYCMIACVCTGNGIGKDNKIPWHIPRDLAYFRAKTLGRIVIMGRKTYESIGKPLDARLNIVITSTPDKYKSALADGADTAADNVIFTTLESLQELLDVYSSSYKKCFIIGGEGIYAHFIDKVQRLYITQVERKYDCDTFFPEFKRLFMLTKASKYSTESWGEEKVLYRFEKHVSIMFD